MADNLVVIAAILIAAIVIFGGSSILTAYHKTEPAFKAFLDEVDARCDLCLGQFTDITCTHDSISKVCIAVRDTYCLGNCTVQLESK